MKPVHLVLCRNMDAAIDAAERALEPLQAVYGYSNVARFAGPPPRIEHPQGVILFGSVLSRPETFRGLRVASYKFEAEASEGLVLLVRSLVRQGS